jgi:two-component system sensor histidine kinase UhpB
MPRTRLPLFWRVFAVNAGLLTAIAVLLIVTPVTISTPIALAEAVVVTGGLLFTIAVNAVLLRRAFAPLAHLAERMEMVDLLRPGQRLQVPPNDEVGRVVASFNRMLDRLETERRESAGRALDAQEAERLRVARELHDEVGQTLTAVALRAEAAATDGGHQDAALREIGEAVQGSLDDLRADRQSPAARGARRPRPRQRTDRAVQSRQPPGRHRDQAQPRGGSP